ncbi:MAG: hypothetical protein ACRD3K_14840, partial [Edaphobacter sp.]
LPLSSLHDWGRHSSMLGILQIEVISYTKSSSPSSSTFLKQKKAKRRLAYTSRLFTAPVKAYFPLSVDLMKEATSA